MGPCIAYCLCSRVGSVAVAVPAPTILCFAPLSIVTARSAPYELVAPALQRSEEAARNAVLFLIGRQEADLHVEQLHLPNCMGGLGLQRLTGFEGAVCKAGYIAAASLTQKALEGGHQSFMPLTTGNDPINTYWNEATAFGAMSEAIDIHSAHDLGSMKKLQRSAGNCAKGKLHTQPIQKYKVQLDDDTTRVQAQEHLARLHGLQEGVGTGWLEVRSIKDQWELDDATMKSALRFMLGVSPGPRQNSSFTCTCGHQGSDSHHAMTCRQLQGLWTLRHDQIQSKVQFGAAAAGHSSSIEPQERHLKNLAFGDPGYGKRGDVTVSTVDDLLNIDVTVVHPASRSMRSRASREPGITAREAEKKNRRDHGVGEVGHTFVPFAIETYGRLGVEAVKLLKDWAKTAGEADLMDRNSYLV